MAAGVLGWGPCAELIRAIRVDLRCEQSFEDEVSIQWMPGEREFHAEGPARVKAQRQDSVCSM